MPALRQRTFFNQCKLKLVHLQITPLIKFIENIKENDQTVHL